jgi:ADP-heptose:LPS heptosyltransferase
LGLAYYHKKDYALAVQAYLAAIEMNSEHDRAYYMLGKAYLEWDSKTYRNEAFQAYLKDLEITDRVDSYAMVAEILHEEKKYEEARGVAKKLLELDKTNELGLWILAKTMVAENYGKSKVDILIAEPIVKIGSLILKLYPNSWRGHHIMAEALTMVGEDNLALEHYEKLNKIKPNIAVTRTSAGVLMLRQGRLKQGWEEIGHRKLHGTKLYGMNVGVLEQCPARDWKGELEAGKSILIASEQGIGDQMLHSQILRDLLDAEMNIHMTCTPKIVDLMKRSLPTVTIYPSDKEIDKETLSGMDFKADLLDLGKYLRDDLEKFTNPFYFIQPEPDLAAHFKQKYLQFGDKLKVGISWKSVSKSVGVLKSTRLIQWKDILSVPGIQFINIQYGEVETEISELKEQHGIDVFVDDFDPFNDIEKAVAQISALDMVISVSNAAVHMSGQLNIPTWVLLNQRPLWHWFDEKSSTVWYDALTLYRQQQLEEWEPVISRVAHDLSQIELNSDK